MGVVFITFSGKDGGWCSSSLVLDSSTGDIVRIDQETRGDRPVGNYFQGNNLGLTYEDTNGYSGTPVYFANVTDKGLAIGVGIMAPNMTDSRPGIAHGATITFPSGTTTTNVLQVMEVVKWLGQQYETLVTEERRGKRDIHGRFVDGTNCNRKFKEWLSLLANTEDTKEILRTLAKSATPSNTNTPTPLQGWSSVFKYGFSVDARPDTTAETYREDIFNIAGHVIHDFVTGKMPGKDSLAIGSAKDIRRMKLSARGNMEIDRVVANLPTEQMTPAERPRQTERPSTTELETGTTAEKTTDQFASASKETTFPVHIATQAINELAQQLNGPSAEAAREGLKNIIAAAQKALAEEKPGRK